MKHRPEPSGSSDEILDELLFHRGDSVRSTTLFVFGSIQNVSHFALQIKRLWDSLALTHVIISGYRGEAESIATAAFQLGVPAKAMSLETRASNTFENVLFTKSLLEETCPDRALHVLCKEHCALRCYLTFHRLLPDWKVAVHTTDYLDLDVARWRSSQLFLRLIEDEIGKISTYLESGHLAVPEAMREKLRLLIEARGNFPCLGDDAGEFPGNLTDAVKTGAQPLLDRPDGFALLAYDAQQDRVLLQRRSSPAAARRGRMPTSLQLFTGQTAGAGPLDSAAADKALLSSGRRAERFILIGKFFPLPSLSLERITLYCVLLSPGAPEESRERAAADGGMESLATERLSAMLIDGKSFDGVAFGAVAWFLTAKPYLRHLASSSTAKIDSPAPMRRLRTLSRCAVECRTARSP